MTIKNVVLVHGAFADGSGWEAVLGTLLDTEISSQSSLQKKGSTL